MGKEVENVFFLSVSILALYINANGDNRKTDFLQVIPSAGRYALNLQVGYPQGKRIIFFRHAINY